MGPFERLTAYISDCEGRSFEWGKHDCLTFTNGAYRAMYGKGWADDWLGRYMIDGRPMRRDELRKEFGWSTLEAAINERMVKSNKFPPRGALVTTKHARRWATGAALGICVGDRAVFLGDKGVIYLTLDLIDNSWVKECLK
jgi:hypothetical protein